MAKPFTIPIVIGWEKFAANRPNPKKAEAVCKTPANPTTNGTYMILEAPTVSVLTKRQSSNAVRPDALVIMPGLPPMMAVIMQAIQHDCRANEGGRRAMTA